MSRISFIIIDGYNLLHQLQSKRRLNVPGGLNRARNSLIGTIAAHLSVEQQKRTTIVFDAADKIESPQVDTPVQHAMSIMFAVEFENADAMIQGLLQKHANPRQTIVVSSDRQVQSFAKRRRAHFIDSLDWYTSLEQTLKPDNPELKPPTDTVEKIRNTPLERDERKFWLDEFGIEPEENN